MNRLVRYLLGAVMVVSGAQGALAMDAQGVNKLGGDTWLNRTYQSVSGGALQLNEAIGTKPVYLKFWASWCKPCRAQMPHFVENHKKYADKVTFIAVNIDVNDEIADVKATMAEFGMQMPIIVDERGDLAHRYKIMGTPTSILLDAQGQIVHKGHKASKKLDERLAKLASFETMPVVKSQRRITPQRGLVIGDKGFTSVFFTATWCDWYLAETRPKVSENCIKGQRFFNRISKQYPKLHPVGVLSPLWTELKDLKDYQKKYRIVYRQLIDINSAAALKYQVKDNPTLLVFKDGIEVLRVSDFSDEMHIGSQLKALF